MGFFRRAARDYLVYRIFGGGGHRHRRGRHSRGRHAYYGRPRRHHRRRSNVQVTGCCLPIPLGVVAATAIGGRAVARRSR